MFNPRRRISGFAFARPRPPQQTWGGLVNDGQKSTYERKPSSFFAGYRHPLPSTRASRRGSRRRAGWASRVQSRAPRAFRGCGRRGNTCPCRRSARARWCGTRTGRKYRTHKNEVFASIKAPYSHRCVRHVGTTVIPLQAWYVVSTRQGDARPNAP